MTDLTNSAGKPHRFEVLDSWRGLCACMIVFFHFNDEVFSHFQDFSIVHNAYIFVDFFFVLSGFVICASYQNRLLSGMPVKEYALLRLGRIYPLHFFTLMLFVAFECTKFFVDTKTAPFSHESSNVEAFITNIFLVQSLGFLDHFTWNQPAWSISVEFYTYIIYAFSLLFFRKKLWIPAALVVLVMPFIFMALGKYRMDITYDYGILRCIYGFSAGILAFKTYGYLSRLNFDRFKFFTLVEVLFFCGVLLFVATFANNQVSFWSPYIFFFTILLFSLERGLVSRILRLKPFLFLGMLSYSIYMVHTFVQLVIFNGGKIIEKIFPLRLFRPSTLGKDYDMIGFERWQGDIVQVIGFIAVIIFAYLTYILIERPFNEWTRAYVKRKNSAKQLAATQNP